MCWPHDLQTSRLHVINPCQEKPHRIGTRITKGLIHKQDIIKGQKHCPKNIISLTEKGKTKILVAQFKEYFCPKNPEVTERTITESNKEQINEPMATSRADVTGHRSRYSDIRSMAGVMTACRKSEGGNIRDHNLNNSSVLVDGQQIIPPAQDQKHSESATPTLHI